MSQTPNRSHLFRTKCIFFSNCKRILYNHNIRTVTYEFAKLASQYGSLVSQIGTSLKLCLIFETDKYYLCNYKLTKTKKQKKLTK